MDPIHSAINEASEHLERNNPKPYQRTNKIRQLLSIRGEISACAAD